MKGDFSRWTFRPEAHYHGVLKQQGRVDLDSDWNEQGAILSHRIERETVDVIGNCGAPAANAGFIPAPGPKNTLLILKGRAYIDGLLCESETDLDIGQQPQFPGFTMPTQPGIYLAFLRVWLRHVTALDDPEIREVALGGPDTCTRAQTVWQVGLLAVPSLSGGAVNCSSQIPAWEAEIAASTGTLSARAQPDPAATDPCTIPAKAGYRRLENQLYRVEIHQPGKIGDATFKWSRDNGSIVTQVTGWVPGATDQITVASTGPDAVLGLAAGQWIELSDDTHELNFLPGTLVQLANVEGLTLTLNTATATGPIAAADFPRNPKVRRWDSTAATPALQKVTIGSWLNLESGVQVNFSDGVYQTGDYWLIPARTLTADVDWPIQNGIPAQLPPKGIRKHYCKLAIVQLAAAGWIVPQICLPVFPPLSGVGAPPAIQAIHVTAVNLISASGTSAVLRNDSPIPAGTLAKGASIQVLLDSPVDRVSVQPATCVLTVELPRVQQPNLGLPSFFGFQPLVLVSPVTVSPQPRGITFALSPELVAFIRSQIVAPADKVLMRLKLEGSKIWSSADPNVYLDGEAFGVAVERTIGLRFPGGGGLRGSDFEMWFWLTNAAN